MIDIYSNVKDLSHTEKKRVLIIDDEPTSVWILDHISKNLGFETKYVPDLESAQLELSLQNYDLIFIDWIFPEYEGDRVIDELAHHYPNLADLEIIIFTGLYPENLELSENQLNKISEIWSKSASADELNYKLSSYL